MIQVLERASEILEYLAANRGRNIPLGEISSSLGIHKATCANILKTMKQLGLIQQEDYRSGYTIGDRIYTLAGVSSGRTDRSLIRAVKPIMDSLCKEINENLMLTVIHGTKRIHIYKAQAENDIEAKVVDEMDPWPATTAKVIVAHYDKEKLNSFINTVGMPGKAWPEVENRQMLYEKLDEIRNSQFITVINHHFACVVAPIFKNGEVVASLGCYLPDIRLSHGRRENIEKRIVEEAAKASAALSR